MIATAPTTTQLTGPATSSIEHECLTASELARYLRVNRKTVYEYAGNGIIPCRRLGRRLLFSRAAIVAWLARQTAALNPGVSQ